MKRNSEQIEIVTPGAATWLRWIDSTGHNRLNGYPDFSGFNGASRDVREVAWQNFLDSGEELEIVPDTEPILEPPSPDWDGLYTAFIASQTYQYLVGVGLSDPKISSELSKVGTALVYGIAMPNSPAALPAFQSALNLFLFALSEGGYPFPIELKSEVESILSANNFQSITLP